MPSTPTEDTLVSVVIPAYNVGALIAQSLDSVFAQHYRNFEILVVNDGSPDTPVLEAALAPYRDRITYIVQENAGPAAARNAGVERARGELIAFLDGDDLWLPECLSEQVARANADRSLAVIHADAEVIDHPASAGMTLRQLNRSGGEASFTTIVTERYTLTTSCTVVRREWWDRVGRFDPTLRRSEDFDLWLRIAHAGGRFDGTTRVLAQYRRHEQGTSSDLELMADAVLTVLDKCERTLELDETERAAVQTARRRQVAEKRFIEGKRAFVQRDYARARHAISEANAVMRSRKLTLVTSGLLVMPRVLSWLYDKRSAR
ncbi:MAG TPA: glycosyltransferase family A protein [Gemmatimonadaceae bacterium]